MKNQLIVVLIFVGTYLPAVVSGQSTVQLSGTVKSSQGALQGIVVEFLNSNGNFQENCITATNGKFKSENKMTVGRTIRIRILHNDYQPVETTYRITRTGDVPEFMLKRKLLAISGFVKDSLSEQSLAGAEIFFYNESVLIQSRSTNSMGYYDIQTGFTYGQKITVRVARSGYHEKEQTLTFTSDGRNTLQDIMLPQIGDRGLRAYISVTDKRTGRGLSRVPISYFDKKRSSFKDTLSSSKGELFLKLYQHPGTSFDLKITKPNYKEITDKKVLSEDPLSNEFKYELVRDRQTGLGKIFLAGGAVAAVASGTLYFSSAKKYDSYKDFRNSSRENDFTTAQAHRTISAVAGGVAVAAITGYIVYKVTQRNRERALDSSR